MQVLTDCLQSRYAHALAACALVFSAANVVAAPPVFVEDLTWQEVQSAIASGRTTALVYAGSTEQNGPHLVLGKHNVVVRHVAGRIAAELGDALVYPIVPFAPTGDAERKTGHMRFPGSVHVSEATYAAIARDLAASARAAGFRHVVLMGDHGGGQKVLERVAAQLDRAWRASGARCHYAGDVYFAAQREAQRLLGARGIAGDDHAGTADTAELMALDAEARWVRRAEIGPGDPAAGVRGDPRLATAEIGRALLDLKVRAGVAQIRALTAAKP